MRFALGQRYANYSLGRNCLLLKVSYKPNFDQSSMGLDSSREMEWEKAFNRTPKNI